MTFRIQRGNSSGGSSSRSSSGGRSSGGRSSGGRSSGGKVTGTADTGAAAAQAALLEAERQRQEAEAARKAAEAEAQRKADEAARKAAEAEENETEVIMVLAPTTTSSTMVAIAETIMADDDDEPEEGSYAGDTLGNIGFGSDGVSPGAVIEEGTGEVDIERAEEIAQNSPEIQRVVEITRIVNDEQLTDEEKASLLDCYSKTYDADAKSSSRKSTGHNERQRNNTSKKIVDKYNNSNRGNNDYTDSIIEVEIEKLVDNNDIEAYGNTLQSGYAEIDVKYNYASYEYEDYILAEEPEEAALPSFSNFINLGPKSTTLNAVSTACLSYDGILPRTPRTYFGNLSTRSEKQELANGSVSIYYQDLFSALQLRDDMLGEIAEANKNYFFHQNFTRTMTDKNFLKKQFPVYVNIELSSFRAKNTKRKVDKTLAGICLENEMETRLFKHLVERAAQPADNIYEDQDGRPVRLWGLSLDPIDFISGGTYNNKNSVGFWQEKPPQSELPKEILSLSLDEFKAMRAGVDEDTMEQEIMFFKEQKALSEKLANMSQTEMASYREGSYLAAFKKLTRSFLEGTAFVTTEDGQQQLNRGANERHKETIMFKVSKYEEGNEEPIQNFFFMNDSEKGPFSFVDTQVNLAKTYSYRVFAYELTLPSDGTWGIMHENETFRKDNVYIVSKPPMPPDVAVAPYMGNENDVLFLMNDSSGKALMEPIFFEEEDRDRISKISGIYGKKIPDPTISAEDFRTKSDEEKFKKLLEYEYDGRSVLFEVYRTDTPPRSYTDFAGKRMIRTTGTSYKDQIVPNKKYFYTFRCMDNHGNVSNPSAVYEVEIVKSFNVFPNIRVYEFPNEVKETRETKRAIKKFLRITPETKFLPMTEQGDTMDLNSAFDASKTSFTLGGDGVAESLWDKKFKLRLTSKSSGKKIDFNFSFTKSFIGNT